MLSNGQPGVIKPVSDFRRERMCQLPNGTGVRVTDKLSTDSVLMLEYLAAFFVSQPVANLRRLPTRAQADNEALGAIARLPRENLAVERVNVCCRIGRRFRHNVELRERFRFEFSNGLRLQLFPIVGPRDC